MSGDLIRREDAIKAILGVTTYDNVEAVAIHCDASVAYSEGWLGGIRDALSAIEDVPSAEPDGEAFEWCHDCKEYDQENYCCHRWTKVIRQTVEEMKAESERKWIPVTEALPDEEKDVLVSVHFEGFKGKTVDLPPSDYVEIASHVDGVWSSLSDEYKAVEVNHHVVAWMETPEPWRGE